MSNSTPDVDADGVPPLDELADTDISELLTTVEFEMPDGTVETLAEVATDLVIAHNEIEEYKNGALALSQSLDEALIEHEAAGNEDIVDVLKELKRTAFGVYLRVRRGDDELLGERDGTYSGYYADEDE